MTHGSIAQRAAHAGRLALLVVGVACSYSPVSDATPPSGAVVSTEVLLVDTLASGLVIPWGIAEAPDGRLFVTERAGRLRIITSDGLRIAPLLSLPVHGEDPNWHPESGLMGIALDPDFTTNGVAYLMATFARADTPAVPGLLARVLRASGLQKPRVSELAFESMILRLRIVGDSVASLDTLVRRLPAFHYHAGGAVTIGPDRKLYITVGDVRLSQLAGDPRTPVAAVLRYELDGRIPADNPEPPSPVWAIGLRNTQALVWTSNGALFAVDHGPSGLPGEGGRAGRDELNYIEGGRHYGWPVDAGPPAPGTSIPPLHWWPEAVAPAGLATQLLPDGSVALFVGRLRGGIEQVTVALTTLRAPAGDSIRSVWTVVADTLFALPDLGRIRNVLHAADGSLYVTTSNRDIRGSADALDDLVVRIRRAPTTAP
jgi:glucose/arabinose dehydrogenase